ncbi:two-component sensor histidine kinase, partial [Rhizobium ruizarguesonis]
CSEVVVQLAPWVYENEHSLELSMQAHDVFVKAVPALLKDSLRNLIENAVRHTPNVTNIVVRVGTKGVEVEDRFASVQQAPAYPVYRS